MNLSDTAQSSTPTATIPAPMLEINTSRQFSSWLAEQHLSIAFTTYQIGKVYFIGLKPDNTLSVFERSFNRCMGLCTTTNGLYMSSLYQVWRFENILEAGQQRDGFDRIYRPQVGYTTGDLDIHDMAIDSDGRLIFVNTLFGCLATLSDIHSFRPIWQPFFLNKLAAEDRCHLNGLAMKDNQPAYVTAISQSNVVDGWRDHRANGGIVMDVARNEIVCSGLSMPHSPRWYRGKLWLLNSGTGNFGYIDLNTGQFESVCFCPGYMRGLSFYGDFALIGLSKSRENKTFSGLALDDNLKLHRAEPRCGIHVIDLRTGDIVHWLQMEGIVRELYDVVVLPDVRRPMAIGFKTDEIRRVISIEDSLTSSN